MARYDVTKMFMFLLFLITTAALPHPNFNFAASSNNGGFGIRITRRRDSPLSLSYSRPNATAAERWRAILQRSESRYNALVSNPTSLDDLRVPVSPGGGNYEYEMNFAMGTPPVDVVANIDTGSGLYWIQCQPCDSCFDQIAPIFDPSHSTTFKKLPCDHPACNSDVPGNDCNSNVCMYESSYADGSLTVGEFVWDDVVFPTTQDEGGGNVTIPAINFGCGHRNAGLYDKHEQGVVGMDQSSTSLITQLGTRANGKFSYCLVPYYEDQTGSQMLFGNAALLSGQSTPLATNSARSGYDNYYIVNIDDISVGSERLNLRPGILHRDTKTGVGGVIVDTGSPMTYLNYEVSEKLTGKLKEVVHLTPVKDSNILCFIGNAKDFGEGGKIPTLTFHFEGGLEVVWLPIYSFYVQDEDTICLNVASTVPGSSFSVFGSMAQQNINVGIDSVAGKVYMSPRDCVSFGPPP